MFSVHSPGWCNTECQKNLDGLRPVDVSHLDLRMPLPPRSAAVLGVAIPLNLNDDDVAFWADIRELATVLRDCGAEAVMVYHAAQSGPTCQAAGRFFGQGASGRSCPPQERSCGTVHLLGHCFTSMQDVRRYPNFANCPGQANGTRTFAPTVQLDKIPAIAMVAALGRGAGTAAAAAAAAQVNVTVDLHVTLSACGNYGQFPALYWSLVPLWTGLAFVWIALSCQVHSSFATALHSVMAMVPVLKLFDVVISAYLWTDCVAKGTFSTSAVLAWVAIRSLYDPFFMLIFLLIANGWCILRRDMPRSTSLTISATITTLYLVLAVNFINAGNLWWLVGAITVSMIVYSVVCVRGFVKHLTENIETMDPENFQEMHTQAVHKRGMFVRLERIVQLYLVVQIVDCAYVQVEWQGEHAWKSQIFEQVVEILVVSAMGFVFRPKQAGAAAGGRGRYFLEAGADQAGTGQRAVPFYEMSPVSAATRPQVGSASGSSPGAVVVVNPNRMSTSGPSRYSVGQHVASPMADTQVQQRQSRHRTSAASAASVGSPSPSHMAGMPNVSFGGAVGSGSAI